MINRRTVLEMIAGGAMAAMRPGAARAGSVSPDVERALSTSDLIYVATQRRNGTRSAAKPIWFYYDQGKVFFTTSPDSWKAKRIAAGSPLFINVGAADGPAVRGIAEPVTDPAFIERMGDAYARKYWIAWLGFFKPRSARVTAGKTMAYLVTLQPAAGAAP
jgi:hypothetical protein